MKKYKVKASKGLIPSLIKINGPESEKKQLIKHLTIVNKSVSYQLLKAKERLKFWQQRQSASQSIGKWDNLSDAKVMQTYEEVKKLEEDLKTEYWTEHDGDLYIPAGLYYLCEKVDSELVQGDVEPKILEWMRDYQKEAVKEALAKKRAIVVLPTGAGKSVLILGLVRSLVAAKKRVMVIVPTDYLVGQIFDTLSQDIESITAAGGGRKTKLGCDVLVTTMQSALKFADQYHAIITDESHHLPAQTLQNVFLHAEQCEYSYAVTATPFRSDGLELGIHAFCGPIVYRKDVRWAIEKGWLAEPSIYITKIPVKNGKITDSSLVTSAYKHLVGSPIFIQTVAEQLIKAYASGRKIIVITKTLEVAKKLRKACQKEAPFDVADANFKKPLHDFQKGETNLLVATTALVSEGLDIPDADCLFILTQHSSPITTYQSVGRVLRRSPNKKTPLVIDFVAFGGFKQFDSAMKKRLDEYQCVTANITILEK